MSKFGFEIARSGRYGEEGWLVQLPHQCDEWGITYLFEKVGEWDEVCQGDEPAKTKAEAIQMMKEFIAEAQEALELLEQTQ